MDQVNKNKIADWVKQARAGKGYTQQELSDLAGISLRSVQRIENAEVVPRAYTVRVLAERLGSWPASEAEDVCNVDNHHPQPKTEDAVAAAPQKLNNQRKVILSAGTGVVLLLGTTAFIAQSAHFPETLFEGLLLWTSVAALYTFILYRIWK